VPGKLNTFDFTVEEAGIYRGQCAELCGTYHGSMLFEVHAVDRATFDAWLQKQIDLANQTPAPPPSGGAGGESLPLTAQNTAFSTDALAATADAPFTIDFNNEDVGMPHNVEIKDAGGTQVFLGKLITGPAKEPYAVPPLKAGAYTFVCTVHPNMTGTLTVQ
jgi:plastocyanin